MHLFWIGFSSVANINMRVTVFKDHNIFFSRVWTGYPMQPLCWDRLFSDTRTVPEFFSPFERQSYWKSSDQRSAAKQTSPIGERNGQKWWWVKCSLASLQLVREMVRNGGEWNAFNSFSPIGERNGQKWWWVNILVSLQLVREMVRNGGEWNVH